MVNSKLNDDHKFKKEKCVFSRTTDCVLHKMEDVSRPRSHIKR